MLGSNFHLFLPKQPHYPIHHQQESAVHQRNPEAARVIGGVGEFVDNLVKQVVGIGDYIPAIESQVTAQINTKCAQKA